MGETKGWIGRRFFRAMKLFCVIHYVTIVFFPDPQSAHHRDWAPTYVTCGLCQCRLINGNKCTTLVGTCDDGHVWWWGRLCLCQGREHVENLCVFLSVFHESKTAFKNKVFLKNRPYQWDTLCLFYCWWNSRSFVSDEVFADLPLTKMAYLNPFGFFLCLSVIPWYHN